MVSVLKLSVLCEIKAITLSFVPCMDEWYSVQWWHKSPRWACAKIQFVQNHYCSFINMDLDARKPVFSGLLTTHRV